MQNALTQEQAKEIFKDAFEKWNKSLSESYLNIQELRMNNPDAHGAELIKAAQPTIDCYAKGARLRPTVKDGPCNSPDTIGNYFAHFAEKNPKGTLIDSDEDPLYIEVLKDSKGRTIIHADGGYTFEMDDKSLGRGTLDCRFEFNVVEQSPNDWKWTYHVSSVDPSSQTGQLLKPVAGKSFSKEQSTGNKKDSDIKPGSI